jgi:hypothetical protein
MPNFNVHWLVAREAAKTSTFGFVQDGETAYASAAEVFRTLVEADIQGLKTVDEAKKFVKTIQKRADEFQAGLSDAAICFSAFMCGACGPDFWTLPSGGVLVPDFASNHFDLGHYNRTHMQYLCSIEKLSSWTEKSQQDVAEISYFMGMATHFGADLVIHQLVNMSAGAYNLMKKSWGNEEQGGTTAPAKMGKTLTAWKGAFQTHNKVEHYWDTYVRLRYLGNYGKVFDDDEKPADTEFPQLGKLPTIEALRSLVSSRAAAAYTRNPDESDDVRNTRIQVHEALVTALQDDKARFQYERPLAFPQPFADQVLNKKLAPFVYRVVVDPSKGAYPTDTVPAAVTVEKTSPQMNRLFDLGTEKNKLEFFSSSANEGAGVCSNNYLTYFICPPIGRLQVQGQDVFYDRSALAPFLRRALLQATAFSEELYKAYQAHSATPLQHLTRFWNLDTGLGIRVVHVPSDTSHEVTTRLDFVHVLDRAGVGFVEPIHFPGGHAYVRGVDRKKDGDRVFNRPDLAYNGKGDSFPTRDAAKFPGLAEIQEADDKAFLARVQLEATEKEPSPSVKADDDSFFPPRRSPVKAAVDLVSSALGKDNKIRVGEVAHRLNIEIGVAIPRFGTDPVGMFLHGSPDGIEKDCTEEAADWIKKARILKALDDTAGELVEGEVPGLTRYRCHLLANFELEDDLTRKIKKGEWNNVVPYSSAKRDYGRNFAIATARTEVLRITGNGDFDARNDFARCPDLFPTEQLFFTLYVLVRTPKGVYDVFTKKKLSKGDMLEIRRIQAVGFAKIVLLYEFGKDGACQLADCYVDAAKVPVVLDDTAGKPAKP